MDLFYFFITFLFGFFLIVAGYLMFFQHQKVRTIISKAGSTSLINYSELSIRLLVGIAMICVKNRFELFFTVFGSFLAITAVLLMIVSREKHHKFSEKAAHQLEPIYLRIASPISILTGIFIIYAIL